MNHLTKKYTKDLCFLELSRPQKRNALNREMIEQMINYLEQSAESTNFRVLIISGKNKFFSAGADLEWMQSASNQSREENFEDAALFNKLYSTLYHYPKPVIAMAEGGAYGGAIGLLACADIVTSTPDANFAFSETALGMIPATVAPWIRKKTSAGFIRSAFLTGKAFNGVEAKESGLVQYLFSPDRIQSKTRDLVNQIATNGPGAIKETKALLNRIDNEFVSIDEELMQYCSTKIAEARISIEGQEGLNAFLEKRKPSWTR